MSLVNDALKRAKEAQQPTPAPPISGPPFQELDTAEDSGRWITSPITMAVVAVIALIVVWQSLRRGDGPSRSEGDSTPVAARSNVTPEANPATVETPSSKPETAPGVPPDTTNPSSGASTNTTPHSATGATTELVSATQHEVVPAAPPTPPPLKLQAVIWSPKRPSGMISGSTVFVGDQIRDFKVTKITQDSVTLSGSGEVKVLKLAQ
jgi:hypothetical protein